MGGRPALGLGETLAAATDCPSGHSTRFTDRSCMREWFYVSNSAHDAITVDRPVGGGFPLRGFKRPGADRSEQAGTNSAWLQFAAGRKRAAQCLCVLLP